MFRGKQKLNRYGTALSGSNRARLEMIRGFLRNALPAPRCYDRLAHKYIAILESPNPLALTNS